MRMKILFLAVVFAVMSAVVPSFCSVCSEIEVNDMINTSMDTDAAVWEVNNNTNYTIYVYTKKVSGRLQVYCYTVNQRGVKSNEVRVSNLSDESVYDNEVVNHVHRRFPNARMPADITPSTEGDNIRPKVACDRWGSALVVWQFRNAPPRGGAVQYSLILGVFLTINQNDGSILFTFEREPFIVNSFHHINQAADGIIMDIHNFAPVIDNIEFRYFCVAYNEYIPTVDKVAERLVVKAVSDCNRLDLYRGSVPDEDSYATPYYNVPTDIDGHRRGDVLTKDILCDKTLRGYQYRIYLVYDGVGIPSNGERNDYIYGDLYMVILLATAGRNGFYHEPPPHGEDDVGLFEESNSPSPYNTPQLITSYGLSVVFVKDPALCMGKDGLVIAFTVKWIDLQGRLCYVNKVIRVSGELPRFAYHENYSGIFLNPNIVTDIVSDSSKETLIIMKKVPNVIILNQSHRLGTNTNCTFNMVELKAVIIGDSDWNLNAAPNPGQEILLKTGFPGYLYGGKYLVYGAFGGERKKIFFTRVSCADYKAALTRIMTYKAKMCTYSLIYPLIFPEGPDGYLDRRASLNLTGAASPDFATEWLRWNYIGVDQNFIDQEWISPSYTVYYFKDDGQMGEVRGASPALISGGRFAYAAYVIMNFNDGFALKSNIKKFTLNR